MMDLSPFRHVVHVPMYSLSFGVPEAYFNAGFLNMLNIQRCRTVAL